MICRRKQQPFNPTPTGVPIGQRTQIAFILKRYQFSGCSLWDGNSNADVTGSGTIPLLGDIAVSRGTPNSGYAQQLPYIGIGNAGYTPPGTNNTNKSYNATLSATISGNPIGSPQINTNIPHNHVDLITHNLSSLKGDIWRNWLGKNSNARAKASTNKTFQRQLQQNYGSGFEIEAYVFPHSYPIASPTNSIWLDNITLSKYQFLPHADLLSINFSTDNLDPNKWFKTHQSNFTDSIRDFIANSIQAQVVDPSTSTTEYTFGAGQGWVYRDGLINNNVNFNVTLITGVMLPDVSLQGASQAGNTASEFSGYLNQGYDTNSVKFWDLGNVDVSVNQVGKTDKYTINVKGTLNNPSSGLVSNELHRKFNNEGLFIRGNDGQFAASFDTVKNYLNESSPKPYGISSKNNPVLQSNPWQGLMPNIGPAYSATLLNKNILYPLIWYVPAYVDPFHS